MTPIMPEHTAAEQGPHPRDQRRPPNVGHGRAGQIGNPHPPPSS